MPLRVLIADDEELARQLLREFLASLPEAELAGEAADGFSAVKALAELKPDVLFLDVQMPKLNGFEVLELLEPSLDAGERPAVIFTTAYDQYALRAFDAHAVDYLLKPFSRERFLAAWECARRQRLALPAPGAEAGVSPGALAALAGEAQPQPLTRLVVKDGARIHILPLDQLLAIEAQDDYVALHTAEHAWLKKQTIAGLEARLDPARFLRVHRGWIVNLAAIVRLEPMAKDRFVLLLAGGRRVPVSRAGYERLKKILGS